MTIEARWVSVPVYMLVAVVYILASVVVILVSKLMVVGLELRSYVRQVRA